MIVDAHNDVLLELVLHSDEERSLELVLRRGPACLFEQYWLPRLEARGVGVQICPLYAADVSRAEARERALAQEAEFRRALEENGSASAGCSSVTTSTILVYGSCSRRRASRHSEAIRRRSTSGTAVAFGRRASPGTT